jgi:hypothetical protein
MRGYRHERGYRWVEAWISIPPGVDYVLLARQRVEGSIEIADPQEGWRIVEVFSTYEEAVHWLREDEYDLLDGRYTNENWL